MARISWAKVYVDLRHHPDLFGRPDCDFRLWVCLILHAKEHCPDGIVKGLTPNDMRGMFGIKAPVKAVSAALEHFTAIGWTRPVEGGFLLVRFVDRQRVAGDTPEAHAARQKEYRKRNASDVTASGVVTSLRTSGVTSPDAAPVTSRDSNSDRSESDAEAEVDTEKEEREKQEQGPNLAAGAAPLSPPDIEPHLLDGWPPALLAQVKDALASTRRSGAIGLGPWRAFLLSAKGFSPAIRVRSAETYLERAYASEGKGERYLVGIMRGENAHGQATLPMRPVRPDRGIIPPSSREEHLAEAAEEERRRAQRSTP